MSQFWSNIKHEIYKLDECVNFIITQTATLLQHASKKGSNETACCSE